MKRNRQHFRGVVWPRKGPVEGTYQYVVAALIVTNRPIPAGTSAGYLDGSVSETFLEELCRLKAYKPSEVFGDASAALSRLAQVDPKTDEEVPNDGDGLKFYPPREGQ